jgi:hypothetical protein
MLLVSVIRSATDSYSKLKERSAIFEDAAIGDRINVLASNKCYALFDLISTFQSAREKGLAVIHALPFSGSRGAFGEGVMGVGPEVVIVSDSGVGRAVSSSSDAVYCILFSRLSSLWLRALTSFRCLGTIRCYTISYGDKFREHAIKKYST